MIIDDDDLQIILNSVSEYNKSNILRHIGNPKNLKNTYIRYHPRYLKKEVQDHYWNKYKYSFAQFYEDEIANADIWSQRNYMKYYLQQTKLGRFKPKEENLIHIYNNIKDESFKNRKSFIYLALQIDNKKLSYELLIKSLNPIKKSTSLDWNNLWKHVSKKFKIDDFNDYPIIKKSFIDSMEKKEIINDKDLYQISGGYYLNFKFDIESISLSTGISETTIKKRITDNLSLLNNFLNSRFQLKFELGINHVQLYNQYFQINLNSELYKDNISEFFNLVLNEAISSKCSFNHSQDTANNFFMANLRNILIEDQLEIKTKTKNKVKI